MPKHKRLVTGAQFKAAVAGKLCVSDGFLVLYIRRNDLGYPRLGVSVGKSCGGAVARNRLKRLLREAWRLCQEQIPAGFDYLLMISPQWSTDSKRAARRVHFEQVRTSFLTLVSKLRKGRQKPRI